MGSQKLKFQFLANLEGKSCVILLPNTPLIFTVFTLAEFKFYNEKSVGPAGRCGFTLPFIDPIHLKPQSTSSTRPTGACHIKMGSTPTSSKHDLITYFGLDSDLSFSTVVGPELNLGPYNI